MSKLNIEELAVLIREFVECMAPQLECVVTYDGQTDQIDDNGNLVTKNLSVQDTLLMWVQGSSEAYGYMLVGWLAAKGIAVEQTSPESVLKAVQFAALGKHGKLIMGDYNDSQKPS